MDLSGLYEAARTIEQTAPPVGVVISRIGLQRLRTAATQHQPSEPATSIMGVQLHPFPDVPEEEIVVFYDRSALSEYMRLREALGHQTALQRLTAEVDDELILEAELKALLDRS